ncbi:MAG: hypothetical protein SGJ02_12350, partial [bacterium]|nr:hypothetical protein [bacterium]
PYTDGKELESNLTIDPKNVVVPKVQIALNENVNKIITVVCPSRELAYPISLTKELGIDTATADFGKFNNGDILKSAAKWIDLSDSETIWRE